MVRKVELFLEFTGYLGGERQTRNQIRKKISGIISCYKEKRLRFWPIVLVLGCIKLKRLHLRWDLNMKRSRRGVFQVEEMLCKGFNWGLESQEGQDAAARSCWVTQAGEGQSSVLQGLGGVVSCGCALNAMGSHWKVFRKEVGWTDWCSEKFALALGWRKDVGRVRGHKRDQLVVRCPEEGPGAKWGKATSYALSKVSLSVKNIVVI